MQVSAEPPDFRAPIDPGSPEEVRQAIAREAELLEPYVNAGLATPPTTPAEDTAERRHVIAAVADLRAREEQLRAIEQAAYARGRDDERRRATYHAHLLALKAFGAPVAYPAVLDMANAISSGKAAP